MDPSCKEAPAALPAFGVVSSVAGLMSVLSRTVELPNNTRTRGSLRYALKAANVSPLFHCTMVTSVLVPKTDRVEDLLLQLEIVMSTSEVLDSVFLEVEPHKIFGPFRTDQPIILNLSIQ
jgi:hypothetical protein